MINNKRLEKFSLFTVLGLTAVRLFFINSLPLTGDEAYYWQWSRHLAGGYYEQGPVLAIVIWLFTLFGSINSEFTVRLGAVFLSACTMWVMYITYLRIYGRENIKGAFLALLFINSSVIFSIGSVLMMHDTVMIFFLSLFLLNLIALNEDTGRVLLWASAGVLLALATMSKYTAGAAYLASLVYFLFFHGGKKPLKGLLVMTFSYIIGCFPVFYWNYNNDWASFRYLLIRGASSSAFPFRYFLELLFSQAGLFSIFLLLPAFKGMRAALKDRSGAPHMLAVMSLFMFMPFALLSLKSKVEANWPVFALYPVFFLAASYASGSSLRLTLFKNALPGVIIVILIHLQAAFGIINLPHKMDPMSKIRGYKEVAARASEVYNKISEKGPVFCAARHYQTASLLSFYMEGRPMVYCILKHEASKNYRFWNKYKTMNEAYALFFYTDDWERWEAQALFEKTETCGEVRSFSRAFNFCVLKNYKGEI